MPSETFIDPGDVEMTKYLFEERLEGLLSTRKNKTLANRDEVAGIIARRYAKLLQSFDKIESEHFIRFQADEFMDECLNLAAVCLLVDSSLRAVQRENALNAEGPYEH